MLKKTVLAGALALSFAPAVATAQSCDLSDLPCARDGKKCNIKFKNLTGISEKTCKSGKSASVSATIRVMAKNDKEKDLGNTLSILAGASGSLNLSNKKKHDTSSIAVGGTGTGRATLTCSQIKTVLSGTGRCKIYQRNASYDDNPFSYYIYLDCDGGDVCTSPPGYQ